MRMVVTSLYQLSHVVNLTEDAIGSVTIHLAVNECNSNGLYLKYTVVVVQSVNSNDFFVCSFLSPFAATEDPVV